MDCHSDSDDSVVEVPPAVLGASATADALASHWSWSMMGSAAEIARDDVTGSYNDGSYDDEWAEQPASFPEPPLVAPTKYYHGRGLATWAYYTSVFS